MPSTNISVSQAIEILSSMVGEYVWFVRAGDYRILRLEFGEPHLTVREPNPVLPNPVSHGSAALRAALGRRIVIPTGEWHVFVEDGLWSVEAGNRRCRRMDADHANIEACLGQLDGQKLRSVAFDMTANAWVFDFDLSGVLRIAKGGDGKDDQWIVFFRDGGNLSCRTPHDIRLERA